MLRFWGVFSCVTYYKDVYVVLFYVHFKINKVTCTHLSLYLGSFSFTLRRDVQQRAIQCTQHKSFTIHLYTMFPLHPLYIHTDKLLTKRRTNRIYCGKLEKKIKIKHQDAQHAEISVLNMDHIHIWRKTFTALT